MARDAAMVTREGEDRHDDGACILGPPRASLPTALAACTLRPWRAGDRAALLRHADNRKVWRNLTERFPHPYTGADADAWLAIAARAGPGLHFAIALDDVAVGGIGVVPGTGVARYNGHFGYWLGEACWGRGIATAAVRALAPYLLAHTPLVRLEAPVFAWNPASMRVLEKAGFVREGVLHRSVFKDGAFTDAVLYARVRAP